MLEGEPSHSPLSALDPTSSIPTVSLVETGRKGFVGVVNSNLVDSASSHTLVSKIKPCMSKYKRLYTVKLRTAH